MKDKSKDIVPGIYDEIDKTFKFKAKESKTIKDKLKVLKNKKADYKDANEFAVEVGKILSNTFQNKIKTGDLPDGKMYYNIAKRLIEPNMVRNHDLVSEYSKEVQSILNKQANISIKAQEADLNQDKIDKLVDKISEYDSFEKGKWLLDEPIKNFTQSIVDDTIKKNADLHAKSGLSPKIERYTNGKCCDWCDKLAGIYNYEDVKNTGNEVFRRHRHCDCLVIYDPKNGSKRTNVHTHKPVDDGSEKERIEKDKIANGLKSKTIKEANEFANSMGFKADYTGVDIQCANEWNLGLYNAKKDFPEIANQINFVGSSQKRHSLLKKDIKEYYLNKYKDAQGDEKEKKKEAESFANLLTKGLKVGKYEMASSYSPKNINEDSDEIDKIFYKYRGITLNKKYFNNYGEVIKKGLYQVKNKWHPEACHTVKATFDHEFAHQIDAYLNIRDNEIIKKLYDDRNKQEITDGLSTYSWKNNNKNKYSEMIAEGWSEYCNNQKPRGMAKTIGKEIEKTWKTRKKS